MTEQCVSDQLDERRAAKADIGRCTRPEAFEHCLRLVRRHQENFSVVSRLLPAPLVPHFASVYAFCSRADDLADELRDPAESLRRLDQWQRQLEGCYTHRPPDDLVFVALAETIREFEIPPEPFLNLLAAFRQDQRQFRYATHEDVLDYCRRSADPVGRLVLYLGRCHDETRGRLADSISSGLQLANFCQDVARDYAMGRVYLPQSTLAEYGYTETMFEHRQYNDEFRRVMRHEVARAQSYLQGGASLVDSISEPLRLPLVLFIDGGLRILHEIRRLDYDVWRRRPTVSRLAKAVLVGRAWWRARRAGSREG